MGLVSDELLNADRHDGADRDEAAEPDQHGDERSTDGAVDVVRERTPVAAAVGEASHAPKDFADALAGTEPRMHETPDGKIDRGDAIGASGRWLAGWCLRLLVIAAAGWVLWRAAAVIWTGMLPVILSAIVCTVLWPIVRKLRQWHFPPALAVLTTLLGVIVALGAVIAAIAPSVASQVTDLYDRGSAGVDQILSWISGPPLNIETTQLDSFIAQIQDWFQSQASTITQTAISASSAATSAVVTLVMIIVLTFFFLKDGERFLPLVRRVTGRRVGWHLSEIATRCWKTLGGFIRTQAIVSFIDAFFIGIGLVIMSVPLAGPLAIITFFGGFIPIVGAFTAGALAVLIALVANGLTTAVGVLILIIAVQQLEGNVLQPVLQSRAMNMHAAIILLSVSIGSGLFGILGAFLAVPAAAMVTEVARYLGDLTDIKTGEKTVEEITFATDKADGPFA